MKEFPTPSSFRLSHFSSAGTSRKPPVATRSCTDGALSRAKSTVRPMLRRSCGLPAHTDGRVSLGDDPERLSR